MTKKVSTKRALLMSALALLLCISMLVGSTFAWFTDSVTSTGNKIVSGKLDIKLYVLNGSNWDEITESSEPLFRDNVRWEPGYMQATVLKVKNAGDLALKWQAQFVSDETLSALADVIDVYVCENVTAPPADRDLAGYVKAGTVRSFVNDISTTTVGTLEPNAEETLGLVLKMQEDATNEYQGLTLGEFDIRIFATQLTSEDDSFGTDYDEDAPFGVTSQATMSAGQATKLYFAAAPSATTQDTTIEIPAGAYTGEMVEMTVEPENTLFNISADGNVVGSINVEMKVNGTPVSEELAGDAVYTVTTYISKGLTGVSVSYTGTDKAQPTLVSYDGETGKLVFTTNHFSEYAVSGSALAYDKNTDTAYADIEAVVEAAKDPQATVIVPAVNAQEVAEKLQENNIVVDNSVKDTLYPVKVGETYFATIQEAVDNANGATVILNNDITIANKINIPRSTIIDGKGHTVYYTGADRVIDVTKETNGADLTITGLTVDVTSSYCQRGINYNTSGSLTLNDVTVKGNNVTYAVNFPSSSDNAKATISNCALTGNIALNVWGENMVVSVTDSVLTSVDMSSVEGYSAVCLNNDTVNIANGTKVTITGGKIIARNENGEPSFAVKNDTYSGEITVSNATQMIGAVRENVAIIAYEGYVEFYGCHTLARAFEKAAEASNATVKLIKDVELSEAIVIPAGDKVVLDLNGKTISQSKTQTAAYSMIVNNGELTIKDSVGTGKISYCDLGNGGEYASNTILNSGKLTVISGRIENNSSATVAKNGYPHAIDTNVELIVEGGEIYCAEYSAIRIWCTTDDNTVVTITGGTFTGSVDLHNVNNSANKGTLNIAGGVFNQNNYTTKVVRLVNFGSDIDELAINISGGTFNGEIVGVSGSVTDVDVDSIINDTRSN